MISNSESYQKSYPLGPCGSALLRHNSVWLFNLLVLGVLLLLSTAPLTSANILFFSIYCTSALCYQLLPLPFAAPPFFPALYCSSSSCYLLLHFLLLSAAPPALLCLLLLPLSAIGFWSFCYLLFLLCSLSACFLLSLSLSLSDSLSFSLSCSSSLSPFTLLLK